MSLLPASQRLDADALSTTYSSGLFSREQAAAYLGVTIGTLGVWACTKRYKLPYVKIGRSVKYRKSDLDDFISSHTVGGTSADQRS